MGTDIYKLFLMGDCLTGKTRAIYRFQKRAFNEKELGLATIHRLTKTIDLDGTKIKVVIWDAPRQEDNRFTKNYYYTNTKGILLFYDITNKVSFDNIRLWIKIIKEKAEKDVEILLLGNKCDLKEEREVSLDMVEQLAIEYEIEFIEISAKDDIRLEEAFFTIATLIKAKKERKLAQNRPIGQRILKHFKSSTTKKVKID